MISPSDVIGPWRNSPDLTQDRLENISDLVPSVNALLSIASGAGVSLPINPKTGTQVSGEQYGGFRPQSCRIGAPKSAHKEGLAVDLYDPCGELDGWCLRNLDQLAACGLYLEDPRHTPGWAHLTIRAPKSGKRVFVP